LGCRSKKRTRWTRSCAGEDRFLRFKLRNISSAVVIWRFEADVSLKHENRTEGNKCYLVPKEKLLEKTSNLHLKYRKIPEVQNCYNPLNSLNSL